MTFLANNCSGQDKRRSSPRSDVSSKLLQLNLQRAVKSCCQLFQVLDQLRHRDSPANTPAAHSLIVVAGEMSDLMACLYQFCFCVNAISGAQDIACYQAIDRLKGNINRCLDTAHDPQNSENYASPGGTEKVALIERLSGQLFEKPLIDTPTADISLDHCGTAHSLMVYLCHRLLELLDQQLMAYRKERANAGLRDLIVPIPVGYLNEEQEQYAIAFGLDFSTSDYTSPFRISEMLINGIKAVVSHGYSEPWPDRQGTKSKHDGWLLYSVDTITLFYVTDRFISVVAGNVGDAVGGNYLKLFITPVKGADQGGMDHLLVRRLLHWLDFDAFGSGPMTVAAIRNIPRYDMENHLTLIGKLLCFVSSPRVVTGNEKSLLQNVEMFLENIV